MDEPVSVERLKGEKETIRKIKMVEQGCPTDTLTYVV